MQNRLTMLFQNVTAPTNRTAADPHIAGWSESFYSTSDLTAGAAKIIALITARATILPKTASIVGYRIGFYNIVGRKLQPAGTQTAKYRQVGNIAWETDVPQVSLMFGGNAGGTANTNRFAARCIPDVMVNNGEYQPTTAFSANVQAYIQALLTGGWGFIGRDLTAWQAPISDITAPGVVSFVGAFPVGQPGLGDYLRFHYAYQANSLPITGTYRIGSIDFANNKMTLLGWQGGAMPNVTGFMRWDKIAMNTFSAININRIVVRKVGRPFENYRGRRSNRAR